MATKKHRVLLIVPLEGGSYIVGNHVADAIRDMSRVELNVIKTRPLLEQAERRAGAVDGEVERGRRIIEYINLLCMKKVRSFKPDVVLVMALAPISPWFIEKARSLDIITALWYVEDYRYYPSRQIVPSWRVVAEHYDYIFTIQKGSFHQKLKASGAKSVHYLPTACNPKIHKRLRREHGQTGKYRSDICFVGFPYSNRVKVFKELRDFNLELWGPGWEDIRELNVIARGNGRWIDSNTEVDIVNGSKVGLNIHSSLKPNVTIGRADFLNPRVFTTCGCGTFQLVDDCEGLKDAFEIGTEVATYGDLGCLKEQLTHYLHNPESREEIARNGMERVYADHTYKKRTDRMFEVIGLL